MTDPSALQLDATHKLVCFGFGYSAEALARRLQPKGVRIAGTRTHPHAARPDGVPLGVFDGTRRSPEVAELLAGCTHVLLSIPPDADGDPALRHFETDLAGLQSLVWIGYLSTIGVYGDSGGAWIDEDAPLRPENERAHRRAIAETQWRAFGASAGKRVEIFRLPGIYGPGRSAIDTLRAGAARRVVKPGQVFNRIHVADIAEALALAMSMAASGSSPEFDTFNLVDDEPAPPQDVIEFAAALLGIPPPPETPFSDAELSSMARSFYGTNRRVSNARLKMLFRFQLSYPTYRDGLRALVQGDVQPE